MVEIAKAIKQDAKVLIMDEPSAPLTSAEVESLFKICELLKAKGVSIIYISHRLEEIFRLSDRIVVLRDGQYIKTLTTKESHVDELIHLMVGRDLTESYPERKKCIKEDEVVLELDNLSGNGNHNISLKLRKGEVLGLGGLVGAGRTELAQVIFGSAEKTGGKIIFNGKEIHPRSPREAIDLGIALVPEDRKRHGALLDISIKNNISMPIYKRISKASVINSKTEVDTANKYKKELLIKTPSINQDVKNLSGGNQQKVILAKWLAANSELIIFDEPTRGIDVGAKFEIYKLINALVESGKTILLISSEMEELMGMSDRIIVLAEGHMTGELKKDSFDQKAIMRMASAVVGG
jgi:ribose transport system ATP-binding protein